MANSIIGYILTRFYFFIKFDTNSRHYGVVYFIFPKNLTQNHTTMVLFFGLLWVENEKFGLSIVLFADISDKMVQLFADV